MHFYDYSDEDKDKIIKLLAHELERQATVRIYNKNRGRSKFLKVAVAQSNERAIAEIQYLITDADRQISLREDSPLRIDPDGGSLV